MIALLLTVVVTVVIAGLAYWLISLLPLPPPFLEAIRVVVMIAVVLYLLGINLGLR